MLAFGSRTGRPSLDPGEAVDSQVLYANDWSPAAKVSGMRSPRLLAPTAEISILTERRTFDCRPACHNFW